MFEALMPALFVPEERWAPGSWGANHPLTVDAQIHHGLEEAGYGYWGFSPANVPEGGYDVYGVDGIGSFSEGYTSNEQRTQVDNGWPGCREGTSNPPPEAYTNGVVTPHAAFLGLRYRPHAAVANLRRLERDFDIYTRLGFLDSVNVDSGHVSNSYLSLDQGMIMAALGNALGHDVLRRAFATGEMERSLRPVIGVEEFNSSPRPCTITGTPRADRLRGTSHDDVICGLGGNDTIDARDGDDTVFGDAGDDRIDGGDGDDTLYGGDGDDRADGGRGFDVVSLGPGD
jgi:Ca2+-binding RTX toxin-like protein